MPSLRIRFLVFLFFLLRSCQPLACAADHGEHRKHGPAGRSWSSFNRLLGARHGNHVAGLADLKRYLSHFGYSPAEPGGDAANDEFDDRLEAAVRLFQSKLGLPPTGLLDAATIEMLQAPRCGVPEEAAIVGGIAETAVSRFAFFQGEPRWGRPEPLLLTYAISPTATIDYLSPETVAAVFRRAFNRWEQVIPAKFVEAPDYQSADIRIGFYAGDHGDGRPFDGVLGVLAHAFSPENGRLHLDAAERWAADLKYEPAAVAVDMESVATHEIGHVLGLAHSPVPQAVMYPTLKPRTRKVALSEDDVAGAQALYGSNPQFRFSPAAESETSSCSPENTATAAVVGVIVTAATAIALRMQL